MEYEWGQDPSAFGRINFSSSKLLHRSMIFLYCIFLDAMPLKYNDY